MSAAKIWHEFTVFCDMDCGGKIFAIPMCGLCGNSGTIKTEWEYQGVTQRIKSICICPNGRGLKKQCNAAKWGGDSASILVGRTTKEPPTPRTQWEHLNDD